MRPNFNLMKASLTGALGGLLFGFDTAVISGTIAALTRVYHLNANTQGVTVSIALLGTVIGTIAAGPVGQRAGSRETLRGTAVLYILCALGCAFAWSWYALLFFRFLGGLAIGASAVIGPVYISELAPAKWRGRLVGMFQFNIVIGILLAFGSNLLMRQAHLGAWEWRSQLGISIFPALLFFILLASIPRSPRWLAARDRNAEALEVLAQMGDPNPQAELADIRSAMAQEHAVVHEPVFRWKYRYPLFLAISIGAFNQLTGVNAVLYYLNSIFASAGFSQVSGDLQGMAYGITNLLFTIVGMAVIDRMGRKAMLLVGAVGTASCLAGIAWVFYSNSHQFALIWLIIVYVAFFAFSQGTVIWVYISEVFPNSVRSKGQAAGNSSHWIMNTVIALTFPAFAANVGKGAPFAFFAAMTVIQFFVVLFIYPETKGHTLEELQRRLVPSDAIGR